MPDLVEKSFYVYAGTYGGQHFCMFDTKEVVDDIRSAISQGYTNFIFDNINEAVYFDIIRKIHTIIRLVDNSSLNYYYITSAQNGSDAYNRYCLENNINPVLKVKSINLFESQQKNFLKDYQNISNTTVDYTVKIKNKLFCCFNKQLREHRIQVFYNILKSNLLDKTYSSFYYGKDVIKGRQNDSELVNVYRQHINIFPLKFNVPEGRYNPVDVREGDFLYHRDSYFSLVTETLFFKDKFDAGHSIFLTEKTFRPIIHKHPFILLAPAYSLSCLRKLGYKTFSPHIDESYDEIENDSERFTAVWNEVERLIKFSDSEWINWQHGIADIVEHNYQVIMNKNNYVIE